MTFVFIKKTKDKVFEQVSNLTANANNEIKCKGGASASDVRFKSGTSSGGAQLEKFVLFKPDDGVTTTIAKFMTEIRDARVSCGFTVADALLYDLIIVIGKPEDRAPSEREALEEAAQNGYVVHFIDPKAANAEQQIKDLLS